MVPPALCFCNSNIPWGGGEKWHLEAALAFARKGWRVFVLCHPQGALYQKVLEHKDITPLPLALGKLSFLNPFTFYTVRSLLQRHEICSVIVNLPTDLKCVIPAAASLGLPNIWYRRGSALPVKNSATNRLLLSKLTGVIVNSQETARLLCAHQHFLEAEKIHLISNGIDIAAFDAAMTALPQQKEHIPSRPLVIGNAGRLNRQKAQHLLLYLGKELHAIQCPFQLVIAGTGEREQELKDLADRLGIAEHVKFLGFQENLASFWQSLDVFVLTSLWEGFGYVLAEAMLAKLPVVAFAVSNIPELITPPSNGLLFSLPEGADDLAHEPDLHDMACALAKLHANPQQREEMGRNGRAFAEACCSQDSAMNKVEALLMAQICPNGCPR